MKKYFLFLILTVFTAVCSNAQLAFPGAEGYGKYTTGGRGGAVYEVTTLNSTGAGSLGAAISASGPRTVVFRVSGTITGNFNITSGNITIAGQTAPGDGICIKGNLSISANNVIVRYIRIRYDPSTGEGDATGGKGPRNVIYDHLSASWSSDEVMSLYFGENVTIQWCMISEACVKFVNGVNTGHRFGGLWGNNYGTYHHNLIANNDSRNPRWASGTGYNDYRNNVLYNWGYQSAYGGESAQPGDPRYFFSTINIIGNYYKPGPATGSGVRRRIAEPSARSASDRGSWYVEGNYVDGYPDVTADNWKGVDGSNYIKMSNSWDAMAINQQSPQDAYNAVLDKAGCSFPKRDVIDTRIIEETRTGTATKGNNGIITMPGDAGGWPVLQSTAAPTDTDHDGMADDWEIANSLNPNDASDRNLRAPNGYTNLENYINGLISTVDSNPTPGVYGLFALNKFFQSVGTPSPAQTFTVSGTGLSNNITATATANYQLSLDGTTWASSVNLTPNAGTVAGTPVQVRLNAASSGTYDGSVTVASTGVASVSATVAGETDLKQKQLIGMFPAMEGGFENQPAGSVSISVPTGAANPYPVVWSTSGNGNIVNNGEARTGGNHFTYTSTSTSTKNTYSPAVTAPLYAKGTKYIVQFYYKAPAPNTGNQLAGLIATTDNSGTTNFSTNSTYQTPVNTNGVWLKYFSVQSLNPSYIHNTVFGGFRFNGGGTVVVKPFDIDDFVVYPADNQSAPAADVTAPDAATAPATIPTSNSVSVSWIAPATGVDGGGYVVVRSTSATPPVLNTNGIYSIGNGVNPGDTVVYIGTASSFTDKGEVAVLALGTTYYYHIFTADKAFNFSTPITTSATPALVSLNATGTLSAFNQVIGSPSASQSFTVSGGALSDDIVITAPAGFEVSLDNSTWATSVSISPANGQVNLTNVYVRFNTATANAYSDNIVVSSDGAATVFVPVTGNASGTLPLIIASAKAFAKDNGVQVTWTTAFESGLQLFVVEKSKDGSVFSEVGTVKPANSNIGKAYAWFDVTPLNGDNYYRIKIVEDGGVKYTGIMKVNTVRKNPELVIVSNPVSGRLFKVQVNGLDKGSVAVRIFNNIGQQVTSKKIAVTSSSQVEMISLPALQPGIYNVQLSTTAISVTQKLMIQ